MVNALFLMIALFSGIAAVLTLAAIINYQRNKWYIVARSKPSLEDDPAITELSLAGEGTSYFNAYASDVITPEMTEKLNTILAKVPMSKIGETLKKLGWKRWMVEVTQEPILLDEDVERFLRKEGDYYLFINNIENTNNKFPLTNVRLDNGFVWTESPEGLIYWGALDHKFHHEHEQF